VASTNASSRLSLPRLYSRRTNSFSACSSLPERIHCWNRRWQVWNGGYFSGNSRHWAPCPAPRTPRWAPHACRATDDRGYPPDALPAAPLDNCPLFFGQLPASYHRRLRESHRATTDCHQIHASDVYEAGSNQSWTLRGEAQPWLLCRLRIDRSIINDRTSFIEINPSAENLARCFFWKTRERMWSITERKVDVKSCAVFETETLFATFLLLSSGTEK